jgi:hypothetical protein
MFLLRSSHMAHFRLTNKIISGDFIVTPCVSPEPLLEHVHMTVMQDDVHL